MADENKDDKPTAGESRPLFGGGKEVPETGGPKVTEPEHVDEVVDKPAEAGLGRVSIEPSADAQVFDVEAAEAAALAPKEEREGDESVTYSSPGIPNFRLHHYQFENGVLHLTPEDAEKFDKLMGQMSPSIQAGVFKIDRDAGEAVAKRFVELNKGRMIQGGETTQQAAPAPKPQDHVA